jgi:DNA-binding transcriptional LysR family regulator
MVSGMASIDACPPSDRQARCVHLTHTLRLWPIAAVAQMQDAETFVAIVDANGLSAAARQLGCTQPTVSRQLAALEARLGVQLLERTTRRLRLTTAGRTYYERCRDLLAMLRDADELVADMGGAIRGGLRVSMPPSYARRRVAPLLPAFFHAFPELRLEIVLTGERADLVGAHFDLVVRLGALRDSSLRCRVLSRERFVLCASPGYLDRHGSPATVDALGARRCLVTETFGMRSRWLFHRGRRRSAIDVPACLVSDDLGLLHEAARAGLGPSALPEYLVADDLRDGSLMHVLPRHRLPAFRAYALLPSGRHVPRRVRVLLDFLAARLR